MIELAKHYKRDVILSAELRHEIKNAQQYESDRKYLKENRLRSLGDIDNDIAATEQQIASLTDQREKVRHQIRHETDPKILADNKAERAEITNQIAPLRKRVKRLNRIRKNIPRLLNLLKTELHLEYEVEQQVKEQQRQRSRGYGMER